VLSAVSGIQTVRRGAGEQGGAWLHGGIKLLLAGKTVKRLYANARLAERPRRPRRINSQRGKYLAMADCGTLLINNCHTTAKWALMPR